MKTLSPGSFAGMTFGDWFRVLRRNRFAISPRYWIRAGATTANSFSNTILRRIENAFFGRRIKQANVEQPVFILGVWRSGTTHLHNLFSRDPRFAFPNMYQVIYPHSFLLTERMNHPIVEFFLPKRRLQDNVVLAVDEPQEDELAMCMMTGLSLLLGMSFPKNPTYSEKYMTWESADETETERWKAAMRWFLQKLSFKYARPLVLKSPAHTCRIKMLLEMFPDARFVHIHRHPYDVIRSSVLTVRKLTPVWALQKTELDGLEDRAIEQMKTMTDRYFEEKHLIPADRFHEIRFEDLESDPIGQMQATYDALDLPAFSEVEAKIFAYTESVSGYRKNVHSELSTELKTKLADQLQRCFDTWGYDR